MAKVSEMKFLSKFYLNFAVVSTSLVLVWPSVVDILG